MAKRSVSCLNCSGTVLNLQSIGHAYRKDSGYTLFQWYVHSSYLSASLNINVSTFIFQCAVWTEPITTDACWCLFHVTSMKMSHKFRRSHVISLKMSHKFKRSCQWVVIGGFWSILFVLHVKKWWQKLSTMHIILKVCIKKGLHLVLIKAQDDDAMSINIIFFNYWCRDLYTPKVWCLEPFISHTLCPDKYM